MKTKVKTRQPGKRGTFGHYFKAHWQLYMMVAFPVIMLAVFSYAPMYGILLAFKNYRIVDGIWGSPWAAHFGMDNFVRFFNNYNFMESLRNTLVISLYTLVVNTPCAIILALSLNYVRKVKFKKFVQMVTYLPYFISTIVFVGYQAVGTLGRALLEGATDVRLFGEEIHVCADIVKLPGISGHADDAGLMRWASSFKEKPKRVFVTHGDDQVCDLFAERLKNELGYDAMAPFSGTEFDMLANEFEKETVGIVIKHAKEKAKARKASGVYARLLAAGQRLMTVIRHNEGGANKDLAKFADQINSMCDKWDR